MDGVVVVDKPEGWTSHDVVGKVRRIVRTKRVGHLGTLDPMATGVLPLVIGKATRLAQFFGHDRKVYEGVIRFGQATDSYDRQGEPVGDAVRPQLTREQLEGILQRFRGEFEQLPPPISAKKIAGVPAYKLARAKQPVELKPARVEVYELELREFDGESATIRVACSAGTYVRSIANDAGAAAGCGAHLSRLRRIASGQFTLEPARTIEQLIALGENGRLAEAVLRSSDLLPEFPNETVDAITAGQIRHGRDFRVSPFRSRSSRFVKALSPEGDLIAIGEVKLPNVYHPVLVFFED